MSTLTARLAAARLRRTRHRDGSDATPGSAANALARLWREVRAWRRRCRDREELSRMTERDLRDIGMGEALTELAKPFWRA